jgi:hypothetical protein
MIGFVLCINGIKRGLRHNLIVIKKKRFRQLRLEVEKIIGYKFK